MTQVRWIFGDLLPLVFLVGLISGTTARLIVRRNRGAGKTVGPDVVTAVARIWVVAAVFGAGVITLTPVGGAGSVTGINFVPLRSVIDLSARSVDLSVAIRNIAGNLILFVPIGIALGVALREKPRPLTMATLTGLTVSVTIEVLQYVFAVGRVVDVDDVLLNVAGTWLGTAGVLVVMRMLARRQSTTREAADLV